jgi:membrane protein insertase Oxa1/YidC/SpoIIIJ
VDIAADQFSNVTFLGLNLLVRPSAAVDFGNILGSLPYVLLIAIIVVAGFYQQVQTTRRRKDDDQAEQSAQMQTMQRAMRIMPVIFGFISWNFVAGLGLYFATSNVFRIGQQAVILRTAGKNDDGGDNGKGKEPPEDAPDEPESAGPSKNASKKRNRKRRK